MQFRSGNGAAWLDLLQTRVGRYRSRQVDTIAATGALRAWLRANGLEPTGGVTEADVALVAQTREAMHRVASSVIRGGRPAPADVRARGAALRADGGLQVRRGPDGLRVRRPADVAEAVARLTRDAVQDLSGPRRGDLRFCGDETCAGIFADPTGRRRWCSDQSCGNRMRVRAHRSRAAG